MKVKILDLFLKIVILFGHIWTSAFFTVDTLPAEPSGQIKTVLTEFVYQTRPWVTGYNYFPSCDFSAKRSEHKALMPPCRIC